MAVYRETALSKFTPWEGGKHTWDKIIAAKKEAEFYTLIQSLFPDGIEETDLNDLLWFEDDWIFEVLGMESE